MGTPPVWLTIGSFVFASLTLILGLKYGREHRRDVKEDKREKDEVAANFLIRKAKYRNPKKAYFTPEQYRSLQYQNLKF